MNDVHGHIPVLLDECLALLNPCAGETHVDGTLGRGGHAIAFAERLGSQGTLVGVDLDAANVAYARSRLDALSGGPSLFLEHASFVALPRMLAENGLVADTMLLDLGFSSNQMDSAERGLSFRTDAPLDMRFDRSRGETAASLLGRLEVDEIASLIRRFGEEPLARRIAEKLVEFRRISPIDSTAVLARLVRDVYGSRAKRSRMDPATRTFMALRIAVNDELQALETLLESVSREAQRVRAGRGVNGRAWLRSGTRIGVISFHSLEDRIVKRGFRALVKRGDASWIARQPVVADDAQLVVNPRARSAKLRVIRLVEATTQCSSAATMAHHVDGTT